MVEIYNPQSEGVAEINGLTGDVIIAAGTNTITNIGALSSTKLSYHVIARE
jgi:hypothetical protein